MAGVCRLGDINSGGGQIISGVEPTVIINGRPIALIGALLAPHEPWEDASNHAPHEAAFVTAGDSTVIAGGRGIAIQGSPNSCGHIMITSSGDVMT